MSSLIQMQAVVEAPHYEDEFSCPWAVSEVLPFSMITLSGEMTYAKIGLVIAQLAKYNQIELTGDRLTVLNQIIAAESLVLPGGIQVTSETQSTISPSCCCGLETWRDWVDFLKTGASPWLGHDPSPWIENLGDAIRIWSDGGMQAASKAFHIDVLRDRFAKSLILVEQDLQAFLFCVDSWAKEMGFAQSSKLCQKFDKCFNLKQDYGRKSMSAKYQVKNLLLR